MDNEPLPGNVSTVVRVGSTVRRSAGPRSADLQVLLAYLRDNGFLEAPRPMGFDDDGREVLEFIPGEVRRDAGPWITPQILRAVGLLTKRLHNLTEPSQLPPDLAARFPGTGRVICHNDLAPRNLVLQGPSPVGILDCDFAERGERVWDPAHAAWQFVPLVDDKGCRDRGWHEVPDRAARLRILVDAYGLSSEVRSHLPEVVVERMLATRTGIERLAAQGEPAYVTLAERGVLHKLDADLCWVRDHVSELSAALA